MRHALRSSLLLLAAFGSAAEVRADEPAASIPPELILERFAVNKGGDCLLLPVKVAGKERLFLVDTGCTTTVVDETIPLGQPRELAMMQTAQGLILVNVFASPGGSVGRLPLGVDSVVGMDVKKLQEVSGHPIEGVLGMDFLARYIVHVDFDRGELLLLKHPPANAGEALPFNRNQRNLPELDVSPSPGQKIRLLVDTGHIAHDSGSLASPAMKPLVQGGDFQEVGSALFESAAGPHARTVLQGERIALGGFSVDRPIFSEAPTQSVLGLGFWSRFVVTFDFPNARLYLRKGNGHDRPDLRNLGGLHIVKRDGAVVIHSVDPESPGDLAGIQSGDLLITLGHKRADETTMFEIRKALSQGGPLACSVRRGSEEHRLTLNLPR